MARRPADVAARTIRQLAESKWRSSGLSDKHARRLGLRALGAHQVAGLGRSFQEAGALLIPYWDLDGHKTKFFRVRYLEKLPGAAGLVESPQRYSQPPVVQEVYYPPILNIKWREVADDPDVAVYVTEGELKAACACAHEMPTLGLGGVDSFASGKRGLDLLPSLKEFEWQERQVYVVYDNDVSQKIGVLKAQHTLSQRLLSLGAKISYVSLPPGPEKGLDDYIRKHGPAAFAALAGAAEPFLEAEALWDLNEKIVLVRNIDTVVERATSMLMNPDVFVRHLYANWHYMKQIEKGSGKNKHVALETRPLAPRWVEWECRAELADLTYDPGKPQIVNGRAWNTWAGWGTKPVRGDVRPWAWLLDFLFENDPKARRYFEQWCAYPVQHPGAKLYTAVVLWSRVKRLGKSMAALALSKIYGLNATFVNSRQLKSNFNYWAKDRQLVIGEEITAGEARVDADYLKFLITTPFFTVDTKYKPEIEVPNHTNFLFLSNHPDAVFLEDGDKRYLIHGVNQNSPAPREKYEWCDAWLNGTGPSHLMYYLLHLDLRGFNPREHAPETTSKYEMIIRGKTDTGLWVVRLQEDPATALRALGQRASQECDLFTPEQLYHAFDPQDRGRGRSSVAGLGRLLASAGFRQVNGGVPVMTASGLHRLYAVRNVVRWEQSPRKEVRDHYDSFFGPKAAGGVK